MNFNASIYLLFLAVSVPVAQLWNSDLKKRAIFLIAATVLFVLAGSAANTAALFSLATIGFFFSRTILKSNSQNAFRWCLIGIAVTIAFFVTFKIYGVDATGTLLPLSGVSFLSFVCVSSLIDSYRSAGDSKARNAAPSAREYFASVLFFPTLLSGPIFRVTEWVSQYRDPWVLSRETVSRAFALIASGLFKKTFADLVFALCGSFGLYTAPADGTLYWLMSLTTAIRFYADFSGYSDIAIGTGLLLGFRIPVNFDLPFLSSSLGEFWRRWHTTLGRWMHDYVYTPLIFTDALNFLNNVPIIGKSLFEGRIYLSILITMTLMGAWHGLTTVFWMWGLYHGILLVLETGLETSKFKYSSSVPRVLRVAITFALVIFGFTFIAHEQLPDVMRAFSFMADPESYSIDSSKLAISIVVLFGLVIPHAVDALRTRVHGVGAFIFAATMIALHFAYAKPGTSFVYFRF